MIRFSDCLFPRTAPRVLASLWVAKLRSFRASAHEWRLVHAFRSRCAGRANLAVSVFARIVGS